MKATQTKNFDFKSIQVLGYSTDFNQCECCGKENLKGTISILDLDFGTVSHFGTVCAAKADKYDTLEAFAKAKKEIAAEVRKVEDDKRFSWQMRRKFGICESKIDALESAYVSFRQNPENRIKRFDWESWK